jgi:pimeloyl-ACP methyl ester carboxylesterase
LLLGETMAGWRVRDARAALGMLAERSEVDGERLGLVGISGGGTVGLHAAALDERVKALVLSGSFCTVRDSVFAVSHCMDNYVPGLLRAFEAHDLAALVAPRALFVESGTEDDIFPVEGVRRALVGAERVYGAWGATDRLRNVLFAGGHEFRGVEAFAALDEWLGLGGRIGGS